MSPPFERRAFRDTWPLASDFLQSWRLSPGLLQEHGLQALGKRRPARLKSGPLKGRTGELRKTEGGGSGAHLVQHQRPDTNRVMVLNHRKEKKSSGSVCFSLFSVCFHFFLKVSPRITDTECYTIWGTPHGYSTSLYFTLVLTTSAATICHANTSWTTLLGLCLFVP